MNYSRKIKVSLFYVLLMDLFLDISYATGSNSGGTAIFGAFKLLMSIIIFAIVIIITVYGTRYLAKNFTSVSQSRYIKSIDRISLTNTFNVYILKISGKYYIIGNTENDIKVIDILDEDELSMEDMDVDDSGEAIVNKNILDQLKELLSKEDKYEE